MLYKNKSLAVYHETWSGYKMDLVAAFKQSLNVLLLAQKWFKTAGKQTNKQSKKSLKSMFMYSADSDNFPGMVKLPHLVAGKMANIYSHMCLILYGMTLVSENPCFRKPMFLTFCTSACRKHTYMETHESLLLWSSWDLTLLLLHSNVFLSKY